MNQQTLDTQCPSCSGTGLYIGYAEHNGAAVVCGKCQGTGNFQISYTPFTGRLEHPDVTHVWMRNPGYHISPDRTEGGLSIAEWQNNPELINTPEAAMRQTVCPAQWYRENPFTDCNKANRYDECNFYSQKAKCWAAYQRPQPATDQSVPD